MNHQLRSAVVFMGGWLVMASQASQATAFTLFYDRSEWEQAISAFTLVTESFDKTEARLLRDGDTVGLPSGVTLKASAPDRFAVGAITSGFGPFADGQILLGGFEPGDALALSFPASVMGFGFDYLDVDLGGVQIAGLFDDVEGLDVLTLPFGEDADSPVPDFFGIVADVPFSRVTLSLPDGDSSETWDLDNLSFATANDAVSVPEPTAAIALAGLALVGFWGSLRRQGT